MVKSNKRKHFFLPNIDHRFRKSKNESVWRVSKSLPGLAKLIDTWRLTSSGMHLQSK